MINFFIKLSCVIIFLFPVNLKSQNFPPKPPVRGLELFPENHRSHATIATCGVTRKVEIQWTYQGGSAAVTKFIFDTDNQQIASSDDLKWLNDMIKPLKGDVVVRIYCSIQGVSLAFIEYDAAASSNSKVINIDWVRGKFKFIRRSRF